MSDRYHSKKSRNKKKHSRKSGGTRRVPRDDASFVEVDGAQLVFDETELFSPDSDLTTGTNPSPRANSWPHGESDDPNFKMSAAEIALEEKFGEGNPIAAEEACDGFSREEQDGRYDSEEDEETFGNYAAFQQLRRERALHSDCHVRHPEFYNDVVPDTNNSSSANVEVETEEPHVKGAPVGWKPPGAPDNYNPKSGTHWKEGSGVIPFDKVDNPGKWDEWTMRPLYKKGADGTHKYLGHALPSGCRVVPELKTGPNKGKRMIKDWEFRYAGHDRKTDDGANEPPHRNGASPDNLFPKERIGCWDADILAKHGVDRSKIIDENGDPDALHFFQLFNPIQEPEHSGIENDGRMAYYSEVSCFTNKYAVWDLKMSAGIGHKWINTEPYELVRFDGVVFKDGCLGGSRGRIMSRFDNKTVDNDDFHSGVYNAMTKTRWLELKRCIKLCNNEAAENQKDNADYDPAYKFDLQYKVLVHNTRYFTKYASLDNCGDETTWGFMGYGEAGTDLVSQLRGKNFSRGGQSVLLMDCHALRPYAYVHRHKKNPRDKEGFGTEAEGPNETRLILEKLDKLMTTDNPEEGAPKGIFKQKPHVTWDNYFSGEHTLRNHAKNGYGCTMTMRRDRLPAGVPRKYLHAEKSGADLRSKSARCLQPAHLKKPVPGVPGTDMHLCSFQSTGSCNIASVNGPNSCYLCGRTKERGAEKRGTKRKWAIEMNEFRELHLSTHGGVDNIDSYIEKCKLFYVTWKYWHIPKLHGQAATIAVACGLYRDCAEGKVRLSWKVQKPVLFHRFFQRLSTQMLQYDPRKNKYPGDSKFRIFNQQNVDLRAKFTRKPTMMSDSDSSKTPIYTKPTSTRTAQSCDSSLTSGVTESDVTDQVEQGRLCVDLDSLREHIKCLVKLPGSKDRNCAVCGKTAYHVCTKCPCPSNVSTEPFGRALCFPGKLPKKADPGSVKTCFFDCHNINHFGLPYADIHLVNKTRNEWIKASEEREKQHSAAMQRLRMGGIIGSRRLFSPPPARPATTTNATSTDRGRGNNRTTHGPRSHSAPARAAARVSGESASNNSSENQLVFSDESSGDEDEAPTPNRSNKRRKISHPTTTAKKRAPAASRKKAPPAAASMPPLRAGTTEGEDIEAAIRLSLLDQASGSPANSTRSSRRRSVRQNSQRVNSNNKKSRRVLPVGGVGKPKRDQSDNDSDSSSSVEGSHPGIVKQV